MADTKFCNNCGQQLNSNSEFCIFCGTKLSGTQSPSQNETVTSSSNTSPSYIPPVAPPPKKSRGNIIASIITVVVIVLIAIGIIGSSGFFISYEEGTLKDETYKSEFIGVKYEVSGDYILEEPDRADLDLQDNTYDEMIAYNDEHHIFLAVVEQGSPFFTEKAYLDSVKEGISSELYIDIDYSYDTITIAGEDYEVLTAELETTDDNSKISFCARKIGKYVAVFMVTQTDDTSLEDILSDFEEY